MLNARSFIASIRSSDESEFVNLAFQLAEHVPAILEAKVCLRPSNGMLVSPAVLWRQLSRQLGLRLEEENVRLWHVISFFSLASVHRTDNAAGMQGATNRGVRIGC
jgi:hypothetical protein